MSNILRHTYFCAIEVRVRTPVKNMVVVNGMSVISCVKDIAIMTPHAVVRIDSNNE